MKRCVLLLPLLALAAMMTGCTSSPPGQLAGGAVYRGYQGQGYYSETPPGTYYGPNTDSGPYYGGGTVAVVRTDVRDNRVHREREQYERSGRRYHETSHREYPAQNVANERRDRVKRVEQGNRPRITEKRRTVAKPPGARKRPHGGSVPAKPEN